MGVLCPAPPSRQGSAKENISWHCCVLYLGIGDLGPSHAHLCQMRCKSGPYRSEVLTPPSPKTVALGPRFVSKKQPVWAGGGRKGKGADFTNTYQPGKYIRYATKHFKERGKVGAGSQVGRGRQAAKREAARAEARAATRANLQADPKRTGCGHGQSARKHPGPEAVSRQPGLLGQRRAQAARARGAGRGRRAPPAGRARRWPRPGRAHAAGGGGGRGGRRRGACGSPPAGTPDTAALKLRGGRPPTALRWVCAAARSAPGPSLPPRARPAELAGVGAGEGPARRAPRAPCTAPAPRPESPRFPPTAPRAPALSAPAPLRRYPRGHPCSQSGARLCPRCPRAPAPAPRSYPPAQPPHVRSRPGPPAAPSAEFSGRVRGSAAARVAGTAGAALGVGRRRAEPLSRAGPARSPGPSPRPAPRGELSAMGAERVAGGAAAAAAAAAGGTRRRRGARGGGRGAP